MTTDPSQSQGDDPDLFDLCPVSQAFEEIGSKWRLVVLHSLALDGEQRFNELQESTTADSATLSRVLKELDERGLVARRLEDQPIATYYRLTEKGRSLATVFEEIEEWADEWTAAESTTFE